MKVITALAFYILGTCWCSAGFAATDDSPAVQGPGKPYPDQSSETEEIPEGMETRSLGNMTFVVPKGLKIEKKGSLLVMESEDEFAVRNFQEITARLDRLEAGQQALCKVVEELKNVEINEREKSDVERVVSGQSVLD